MDKSLSLSPLKSISLRNTKKRREQENRKGTEDNYKNNQKTTFKMSITTELSLITLNVNGLKCSNQKTGWLCGIKKQDHTYADRKDPLHIKKKNTERQGNKLNICKVLDFEDNSR